MSQLDTISDELGEVAALPSGAEWYRIDLHLHSPGVATFKLPYAVDVNTESARRAVAADYVRRLAQAGIRVGAITDYNWIWPDWFPVLRGAAQDAGIQLFPGVELSFSFPKYGLHVLAVFREDEDIEAVNQFLRGLQRDPSNPLILPGGLHKDIDSRDREVEAVQALRERFRCLIILPHPDQTNGFLKSLTLTDAAAFLDKLRPDAIEHLRDTHYERLLHARPDMGPWLERVARVEFSDPKSMDDIGTKQRSDGTPRATYLKLSALDLDAIRLALHDPETRLSIGSVPPSFHSRILAMQVRGAGFLNNITIRWNEGLNALIGGRGTGKSAILETLRYALDLSPYSDHSYRHDLVKHALGSGGKVTVLVERPGQQGAARRYRISRVWGEDPVVEDAATGTVVPIRPAEVFGPAAEPVILGQREIQAVSADEAYRLRLLDDLIGEEVGQRARDIARAREALEANARAIIEFTKQLGKLDDYQQRLHSIEHEIRFYEQEGVAEKLRRHTDLSADGKVLGRGLSKVAETKSDWAAFGADIITSLRNVAGALRTGKSIHADLLREAGEVVTRLAGELEALVRRGTEAIDRAAAELGGIQDRWRTLLKPLEEDLQRLRRELHDDILDPDRLLRLSEERALLAPLVQDLAAVGTRLETLHRERVELLRQYRERLHAAHVLRRNRCAAVQERLQGRLRLTVEFKAQKEEYRRALAGLLRGSGVSNDALDRLVAPEGTDGIMLADAVESGPEAVREQFGLTQGMAQRVVDWLTGDQRRLFELQTLAPSDSVRIELIVDGEPRSLDRLSIGQRATAILLLLFALEGRPLILDQPEDDLDNRFVYEDVVGLLRAEKGIAQPERRRQVIAATHNANIPVLGDAEQVLVLEARQGKAFIRARASIDAQVVREEIKQILEGGKEAFRRRAEKYGGVV